MGDIKGFFYCHLMSPNVTPMPRYGKKTDLEVFEPTNDVEKEGTAHIWWSEIKKQPPHPMHKYALWAVYLFSFPLSPFDKMKVPI